MKDLVQFVLDLNVPLCSCPGKAGLIGYSTSEVQSSLREESTAMAILDTNRRAGSESPRSRPKSQSISFVRSNGNTAAKKPLAFTNYEGN